MFNGIVYVPDKDVKGIVYKMEYQGHWYVGKKQITNKNGTQTNWKTYYGSGREWLEFIKRNEDKVIRNVIWECANKAELHYFENYELYSRHALFDPLSYNRNVSMVVTRRNSKNFRNKIIV